MNEGNHKSFLYKTGTTESSGAILAVRIVVGLPIGLLAGFIGGIFNNIVVPTRSEGDIPTFLAPLIVTALFAATGGMIAWFNRFDSKRGTGLVWAVSMAGALLGAFLAYYLGERYIGPVDLHILNRRLTQVVLFGAAVGANVTAALVAIVASRLGR